MAHKLKMLSLMALAALAMSAMVTSVAQATEKGQFKGGLTPDQWLNTTIDGRQIGTAEDNFFKMFGGQFSCANGGVTFSGTFDGTEKELTINPTYHQCVAGGTTPMTFDMNGCDFVFTQPTTIEGGTPEEGTWTGGIDLTCPTATGPVITFFGNAAHTILVCEVEISAGTHTGEGGSTHYLRNYPEAHVIYEPHEDIEVTPGVFRDDITAEATIKGITATRTGLCSGEHQHTSEAEYSSTITLTGTEDEEPEPHEEHYDLWIEHEE